MRRIWLFAGLLMLGILIAPPALAGSKEYAEGRMDHWVEFVQQEGYEVFCNDVDVITKDKSISYTFDLQAGYYYLVAEGGEDIEDLDMFVYTEGGRELESDTMSDNYPVCEIELAYATKIEVEVAVYAFAGGVTEDYFCFVAGGERSDASADSDEPAPEDVRDYWVKWAEDSGYKVLFTDTGVLRKNNSDSYELDLERGSYHVFAESVDEQDDIDLIVMSQEDEELAGDYAPDNYPICSFELTEPQTVKVEVFQSYSADFAGKYAIVVAAEGSGGLRSQGSITGPDSDQPITDESDNEYVREVLDDYMTMVIDNSYTNMFDKIDESGLDAENPCRYRLALGRGDYIVYAEGGLRIADLDLRVYNEDGYIVAEDTLSNNAPMCEFSVLEAASFEIEVQPYEMVPGRQKGYFVVVVVRK